MIEETNYSTITELPKSKVAVIQIQRAHHRYVFASAYCKPDEKTLEIACGGGQGLGILSENSSEVVGIDIEKNNIDICMKTHKDNPKITALLMNADELNFPKEHFRCIVLYEAIYYLQNAKKVLRKIYQLLKKNGTLIICMANKDWTDFNPSPYSIEYFSVPDLYSITEDVGFNTQIFAAFADDRSSIKSKIISRIKRIAVKTGLMPKTMRGKILLKRIFMGSLVEYPNVLEKNMFDYQPPELISVKQKDDIHTVIFAVCT